MSEKPINEDNTNYEQSLDNTINTEANSSHNFLNDSASVNQILSEFKDEPIQLVISNNGLLETTTEAINILTALKNEKLCILSINGPLNTGKSFLANFIINKKNAGFKVGEKTVGIWIWGNPISLNNGAKLLILDCQALNKSDVISLKLFMLNID